MTLLLRRRGVCKNGGCYPFESEDQKRRGMFRRVITNIDKYASGSYKKPVEKPGAQSGPIVSIIPSLLGGRTKDTANDTSPPASGLPHSSPALPSLSAGTTSLVKSVGSTLTSIWAQAFPFNLKAGPPRRPTAANTSPSINPQQAPGGMTAHSSDETSAFGIGGGPPVVPPLPTEGRSNQSPPTGTSLGSNLLGRIPRLSSALTFTNTLTKLRGKNSASSAATGSPISPVAGISAVNAGGIKEGAPGVSGGPSGTNAVKIGGGLPAAVQPAPPDSNGERPNPATLPGTATPRVIPGLLSAIGLGAALTTSQGERTRPGLLGSLIPSASTTHVRNSERANEGMSVSVSGMSHPNENSVRNPPVATPVTTEGNGNTDMASGTPRRLGSFGLISRLRTTAALRSALSNLKHRSSESGVAPRIPSSPGSQSAAVTNAISGASSGITLVNAPDVDRGVPAMPSLLAQGSKNDVPASETPQGVSAPEILSGLTSTTRLGEIPSSSYGQNQGSGVVVKSTNNSVAEINAGSVTSNNELSRRVGSTPGMFTNYATSPSNATPVATPGGSGNENAIAGAPRVKSPGATSERTTVVAVNKSTSEPQDAKAAQSGVAPANPSLPVAATSVVSPSVAIIPTGVPGGASLVPGAEITRSPAKPPHSSGPETTRVLQALPVPSLMPGGSVTPSETPSVPESSSSGSTLFKTPHETAISSVEGEAGKQPANATPSLRLPAGGAVISSVSTATRGTEETVSRGPSLNSVLPPSSTLPVSKPEEATITSGKAEGMTSAMFSKIRGVGAAVTSPVTGGADAPRRFIRNFLGMGTRRRLIS